jgi:hypothetical protein
MNLAMTPADGLPFSSLLAPDGLSPQNRRVFDYWQSLRQGDDLPHRADFNPARIGPALSRLCLLDAKGGERLACRLAGSAVGQGLGIEISGKDHTVFTPPYQRRRRLDCYRAILAGHAMRNARSAIMTTGRRIDWQELILPFGDVQADGSQQVLVAADFGRLEYHEHVASIADALGEPATAQMVALRPAH